MSTEKKYFSAEFFYKKFLSVPNKNKKELLQDNKDPQLKILMQKINKFTEFNSNFYDVFNGHQFFIAALTNTADAVLTYLELPKKKISGSLTIYLENFYLALLKVSQLMIENLIFTTDQEKKDTLFILKAAKKLVPYLNKDDETYKLQEQYYINQQITTLEYLTSKQKNELLDFCKANPWNEKNIFVLPLAPLSILLYPENYSFYEAIKEISINHRNDTTAKIVTNTGFAHLAIKLSEMVIFLSNLLTQPTIDPKALEDYLAQNTQFPSLFENMLSALDTNSTLSASYFVLLFINVALLNVFFTHNSFKVNGMQPLVTKESYDKMIGLLKKTFSPTKRKVIQAIVTKELTAYLKKTAIANPFLATLTISNFLPRTIDINLKKISLPLPPAATSSEEITTLIEKIHQNIYRFSYKEIKKLLKKIENKKLNFLQSNADNALVLLYHALAIKALTPLFDYHSLKQAFSYSTKILHSVNAPTVSNHSEIFANIQIIVYFFEKVLTTIEAIETKEPDYLNIKKELEFAKQTLKKFEQERTSLKENDMFLYARALCFFIQDQAPQGTTFANQHIKNPGFLETALYFIIFRGYLFSSHRQKKSTFKEEDFSKAYATLIKGDMKNLTLVNKIIFALSYLEISTFIIPTSLNAPQPNNDSHMDRLKDFFLALCKFFKTTELNILNTLVIDCLVQLPNNYSVIDILLSAYSIKPTPSFTNNLLSLSYINPSPPISSEKNLILLYQTIKNFPWLPKKNLFNHHHVRNEEAIQSFIDTTDIYEKTICEWVSSFTLGDSKKQALMLQDIFYSNLSAGYFFMAENLWGNYPFANLYTLKKISDYYIKSHAYHRKIINKKNSTYREGEVLLIGKIYYISHYMVAIITERKLASTPDNPQSIGEILNACQNNIKNFKSFFEPTPKNSNYQIIKAKIALTLKNEKNSMMTNNFTTDYSNNFKKNIKPLHKKIEKLTNSLSTDQKRIKHLCFDYGRHWQEAALFSVERIIADSDNKKVELSTLDQLVINSINDFLLHLCDDRKITLSFFTKKDRIILYFIFIVLDRIVPLIAATDVREKVKNSLEHADIKSEIEYSLEFFQKNFSEQELMLITKITDKINSLFDDATDTSSPDNMPLKSITLALSLAEETYSRLEFQLPSLPVKNSSFSYRASLFKTLDLSLVEITINEDKKLAAFSQSILNFYNNELSYSFNQKIEALQKIEADFKELSATSSFINLYIAEIIRNLAAIYLATAIELANQIFNPVALELAVDLFKKIFMLTYETSLPNLLPTEILLEQEFLEKVTCYAYLAAQLLIHIVEEDKKINLTIHIEALASKLTAIPEKEKKSLCLVAEAIKNYFTLKKLLHINFAIAYNKSNKDRTQSWEILALTVFSMVNYFFENSVNSELANKSKLYFEKLSTGFSKDLPLTAPTIFLSELAFFILYHGQKSERFVQIITDKNIQEYLAKIENYVINGLTEQEKYYLSIGKMYYLKKIYQKKFKDILAFIDIYRYNTYKVDLVDKATISAVPTAAATPSSVTDSTNLLKENNTEILSKKNTTPDKTAEISQNSLTERSIQPTPTLAEEKEKEVVRDNTLRIAPVAPTHLSMATVPTNNTLISEKAEKITETAEKKPVNNDAQTTLPLAVPAIEPTPENSIAIVLNTVADTLKKDTLAQKKLTASHNKPARIKKKKKYKIHSRKERKAGRDNFTHDYQQENSKKENADILTILPETITSMPAPHTDIDTTTSVKSVFPPHPTAEKSDAVINAPTTTLLNVEVSNPELLLQKTEKEKKPISPRLPIMHTKKNRISKRLTLWVDEPEKLKNSPSKFYIQKSESKLTWQEISPTYLWEEYRQRLLWINKQKELAILKSDQTWLGEILLEEYAWRYHHYQNSSNPKELFLKKITLLKNKICTLDENTLTEPSLLEQLKAIKNWDNSVNTLPHTRPPLAMKQSNDILIPEFLLSAAPYLYTKITDNIQQSSKGPVILLDEFFSAWQKIPDKDTFSAQVGNRSVQFYQSLLLTAVGYCLEKHCFFNHQQEWKNVYNQIYFTNAQIFDALINTIESLCLTKNNGTPLSVRK